MKQRITAEHIIFRLIIILSFTLSITGFLYAFFSDTILAYGDAESHLNIAVRVTKSLTPGLAQLGGIWLPLPHLLMAPLVFFTPLWETGIAGAIVSGLAYIFTSVYLFKLTYSITRNWIAAFVAFLVFTLNPNILYLQTTAMTELPLLAFMTISVYYLYMYLKNESTLSLLLCAAFGLAATLSRYDGWFLVLAEAGVIFIYHTSRILKKLSHIWTLKGKKHLRLKEKVRSLMGLWHETEAKTLLFCCLAFVGIFGWMLWDFLILNDPFYFTNSPFSAKSQQQNWLARGELPAYKNLPLSFLYYMQTSYANSGSIVSWMALVGVLLYFGQRLTLKRVLFAGVLSVPILFYTITLYLGQSVIFIPSLTPSDFEWNLFNVRYGVMMIPVVAFFTGYMFGWLWRLAYLLHERASKLRWRFLRPARSLGTLVVSCVVLLLLLQYYLFYSGIEKAISFEDGVRGLSAAKRVDAQYWLRNEYDHGLVLVDDFARTLSIIQSRLPMENVIYVGTKPWWEETLKEPEKYARWIIMQDGDTVWTTLFDDPTMQARLYKYYLKVYTSPHILIFQRNDILAED